MNSSGAAPTYVTTPEGVRPIDGNGYMPGPEPKPDPGERTAAAVESLAETARKALATLDGILARLQ